MKGIDPQSLQSAMNRRKGIFQQMGDAAGFVKDLFRGDTITKQRINSTIQEMKQYVATCFSQIDDLTEEWERTYNQIIQVKKELKNASRPRQKKLKAQGEILLRRYDGYEGNLLGFKKNGLEAEVVIARLRDLIPLIDVPDAMKEDSIDTWAAVLEEQMQERRVTGRALADLESLRPERSQVGETGKELETADDDMSLTEDEPTADEAEFDKRLEEEF